ncbi:hypothetical protein [Bacillus sp. AK128]
MVIFLTILAVILLIGAFFATVKLAGNAETDYRASRRGNLIRLTLLYVGPLAVVIIGILLYENMR